VRILHLAYEDPHQPGSGGGSIRNREINRRLGTRHDIIALVAGYPGAEERLEGRVRWVPLGLRTGTYLDRLSYFTLAGLTARRIAHDLLVEDFGAPFSVACSPLFTSRPVIAHVQWLFADQMQTKYHLPFPLIERAGLRLYHDFIAVSGWLADQLRSHRPEATVTTIPNGVEPEAFMVKPAPPRHLLFIGRLDVAQKGADLLLQSMSRARERLGSACPPLFIIGDGPDRSLLEKQIQTLGLDEIVRFCGRVTGPPKYQMMAEAYAVLMPSRFETFGMVAAETLAAGLPLIAFDVGPLAEVTGGIGVQLIPPFDSEAFAAAIVDCVRHPDWRTADYAARRRWAQHYDWDTIANLQETHYLRAMSSKHNSGASS
jgi:glycosyltransferase involved in cell wall biosynthesis